MRHFLPRNLKASTGSVSAELLFFCAASAIVGIAWIYWIFNPDKPQIGDLLAATLTPAVLLFSLERSRMASKQQAVVDLVGKRFENAEYQHAVKVISFLRMAGSLDDSKNLREIFQIEWKDSGGGSSNLAAHALILILNYWEHLSTLYVNNLVFRPAFEDLVQDLVRDLVGRYPVIIGDMRREDPANMEHLCAVWFVLATGAERASLIPKLGPVPGRLCPDDKWRWSEFTEPRPADR